MCVYNDSSITHTHTDTRERQWTVLSGHASGCLTRAQLSCTMPMMESDDQRGKGRTMRMSCTVRSAPKFTASDGVLPASNQTGMFATPSLVRISGTRMPTVPSMAKRACTSSACTYHLSASGSSPSPSGSNPTSPGSSPLRCGGCVDPGSHVSPNAYFPSPALVHTTRALLPVKERTALTHTFVDTLIYVYVSYVFLSFHAVYIS